MNIPQAAIGAAPFEYAFVRQLKIENLYARAAALDLAKDVIQELIEAEQRRCEVTPDPFNWERVKNQIDSRAGVFG